MAIVGDWNHDGSQTPGYFRPSTQKWYLTDSTATTPAITYSSSTTFGASSDTPVAGDWDGTAGASIGYYRPSTGVFTLSNSNTTPTANFTASITGWQAGDLPVVGDWDGNGTATIGLYRPSTATWYLRNSNTSGAPDLSFVITGAGSTSQPLAADWDNDHVTTPGWRTGGSIFLRNSNNSGAIDNEWFGLDSNGLAVAADWDGDGQASFGSFTSGTWVEHDPSTTVRTVFFDTSGRTTSTFDETGKTTQTTWDLPDRPVIQTDEAGLSTTYVYDGQGRRTDEYGPAPASCFTGSQPNGSCTTPPVPHTHTGYDENIHGLAVAYYKNSTFAGAPYEHGTAFGSGTLSGAWGTTPPAPGLSAGSWSARYTGEIAVPGTGYYSLDASSNSGVLVWVDGVVAVNAGSDPGTGTNFTAGGFTAATSGIHRIQIDLNETGNTSDTASLTLSMGGSGLTYGPITATAIDPRYGLETSTTVDDSNSVPASVTTTSYASPESGLPTSITQDPTGLALATQTDYEPAGNGYLRKLDRKLPAVAGTAASTTTYSYYGAGAVGPTSCPGGTGVDQAQMLSTSTDATPASGSAIARQKVYDSAGRIVGSQVVGDSGWACTTYDQRGNVSTQTAPAYGGYAARTTSYDYAVGGNHLVTAVCDNNVAGSPTPLTSGPCSGENGVITTTTDLLGRVTSYTDVWGKTTTTTYDPTGRPVTTTGPNGVMKTYADAAGRPLEQWLDGTRVATAGNDNAGRLDSAVYANGTSLASINAASGRDTLGRQTKQNWQFAAGLTTTDQETLSQSGKVVDESIDGVDAHSGNNFTYDGFGRLTDAWVPGHHYTYAFAASGGCGADASAGKNTNRTSFTDSAGGSYTYCYDNADRLTSTTDPTVGTIAYDSHGNTTTLGGETLSYDGDNRHLKDHTASADVTYLRDATDRIVARTSPNSPSPIVDRGGATSTSSASGVTTLAINVPTTSQAGDVLIAEVGANGGSSTTITAPSGWTQVDSTVNGTNVRDGIYWHVATSSEPASYSWTIGASAQPAAGGMQAFGNVNTTTPIDVSATATATSTSLVAPTVTTTAATDELLAFYAWKTGGTVSTGPSGMIQRYTQVASPERSTSYDQLLSATGATGTRTLAISVSEPAVMHAVALKQASAPATITERYSFTEDGDTADATLDSSSTVTERTLDLLGGALLTKRATGSDVWSFSNLHGDEVATSDGTGAKQGSTLNYSPFGDGLNGVPDNSAQNFDYGWLGDKERPDDHEPGMVAMIEMGSRPYQMGLGRFLETDPVEGGSSNDYDYVSGDPVNGFDLAGTAGRGSTNQCVRRSYARRHKHECGGGLSMHSVTRFVVKQVYGKLESKVFTPVNYGVKQLYDCFFVDGECQSLIGTVTPPTRHHHSHHHHHHHR